MEDAMGSATTTTTPENQVLSTSLFFPTTAILTYSFSFPFEVEALMKQVADENGLEITEQLASVPANTIGEATAASTTASDDPLSRRLAALRS